MKPNHHNWMLITNADDHPSDYYSLLIDKTQIHLAEKHGEAIRRSLFKADEGTLYINNEKVSDPIKAEFKKRLNQIFNDALAKKAKVSGNLPIS